MPKGGDQIGRAAKTALKARTVQWPNGHYKWEWQVMAVSVEPVSVWTSRVRRVLPPTPGLGGALGRRPDFTSRAAVYAIRTYGGQGGAPRKGRPYPNVCRA